MPSELVQVLMDRDEMTEDEANEAVAVALARVTEDGEDPQDVLEEEFGLEPDYVFDLLSSGSEVG